MGLAKLSLPPAMLFLLGLAIDIGGWQSQRVALAVMATALLWGAAVFLWHPIRKRIPIEIRWQGRSDRRRERILRLLFGSSVDPYEHVQELVRAAISDLRAQGGLHERWGLMIDRWILQPSDTSQAVVRNDLLDRTPAPNKSITHLQLLFGDYYRNYQHLRTYLLLTAQYVRYNVSEAPLYQVWRKQDQQYLDELSRQIGDEGLQILAREVNAVGWGETVTRDLPAVGQEGAMATE